MKASALSFCLAASLALLCACGPKPASSQGSEGLSGGGSSALFQAEGTSSQGASSSLPTVTYADAWLAEYAPELAQLGRSLDQLTAEYDILSYDWWPNGREGVRLDTMPLLFSGPPHQADSVCAALGVGLVRESSVDVLRSEWEDTLLFDPNDPVAGACWRVQAGEITFRFLTDSQGRSLRTGGASLVLSRDDLLPEQIFSQWADAMLPWIDQRTARPGPVWDILMDAAAILGKTDLPQGATQLAETAAAELYAGWGVVNPFTGIGYFSFEQGQPWEAVTVPAALVFGDGLPADRNMIIAQLNTPFSWSLYNQAGYWFYLGDFKLFLPSDEQGIVVQDAQFLVRWGDNAG